MKRDSHFGNEPWARMVEEVRGGAIGRVAAVAVQAVCLPGQIAQVLGEWRSRLDALLGPPIRSDLVRNGLALSLLLRYEGPVIGRIFVDESAGAPAANVEIVGEEGLLVWKPDVRALSIITSAGGTEVSAGHAYATGLAEVRP